MTRSETDKLLQLAAARSTTAKGELTNILLDLFLPNDQRLTEHERALMNDILSKLVQTIEEDVRAHLAEAVSRAKLGLPDLERLLANDAIHIARPILESSEVLKDLDLIEIIKNRTEEHRMVIAMRKHVSSEVSDALIDLSGSDVIEALLRNENATISRRAMEYLVSESKRYDRFQEPLVSRHDLPTDLAHRLYWWVSAALRRHILRDFPIDERQLDSLMQDATRRAMAEIDENQNAQGRAIRLARQLYETGELTDAFLIRALRQQRLMLFVAALAERGRLHFQTTWKIVTDPGFESFIVLARAIELSRSISTSMVLLLADVRRSPHAQKPSVLTNILSLYDELSHERAAAILALWQRDLNYQAAIDTIDGPPLIDPPHGA